MKNKYINDITKDFDNYNDYHHYMFYDESDIKNKELSIRTAGFTVGTVVLNNSGKIFSINVDTNLRIRYSDYFEKTISDKYMDTMYDFSKDMEV